MSDQSEQDLNPPNVVMGRLTIRAGSVVHVAGWPVKLVADAEAETNAVSVPYIEADMVRVAADRNFIAGSGAPVDLGDDQ